MLLHPYTITLARIFLSLGGAFLLVICALISGYALGRGSERRGSSSENCKILFTVALILFGAATTIFLIVGIVNLLR